MGERIQQFLCGVAGIRKDALQRAPKAMGMPMIFGLAILCTSTVATFAAAYGIHRVFYGNSLLAWPAALVAGILWGVIVFCIDRSMINLDKSGPLWKIALLVAARVVLAVAVGMSIAVPIFLRIARNQIDLGIYEAARGQFASEATQNADREGLPEKARSFNDAEEEAKNARSALGAGPSQLPEYVAKLRYYEQAEAHYRSVLERTGPALRARQKQLVALPKAAQNAGPLYEEVQSLKAEIRSAAQAATRANEDVKRVQAIWQQQASERLTSARQNLDVTRRAADDTTNRVVKENAIADSAIMALNQPDLATEYARADQIMRDPKNPYSHSLSSICWRLHTLFIGLEVLLVSLKLLTPESNMDQAIRAVEAEEQESLAFRTNANISRWQAATEAASEVCNKAIAKWRKEHLEILELPAPLTAEAFKEVREECERMKEAAA